MPRLACCMIMVIKSNIISLRIEQVLVLAAILLYWAPILGNLETMLFSPAQASVLAQKNVTVVYEVMDSSVATVDFD